MGAAVLCPSPDVTMTSCGATELSFLGLLQHFDFLNFRIRQSGKSFLLLKCNDLNFPCWPWCWMPLNVLLFFLPPFPVLLFLAFHLLSVNCIFLKMFIKNHPLICISASYSLKHMLALAKCGPFKCICFLSEAVQNEEKRLLQVE